MEIRFIIAMIILEHMGVSGKPPEVDPEPSKAFTFKIREIYHSDMFTRELISGLAKKNGITMTKLYHEALRRFQGPIVKESNKIANIQVIVRLTKDDKELAESLSAEHGCNIADVMRSAIYEELERNINELKRAPDTK